MCINSPCEVFLQLMSSLGLGHIIATLYKLKKMRIKEFIQETLFLCFYNKDFFF